MSDAMSRRLSRAISIGALLAAGYYLLFGGEFTLSDVRELRAEVDRREAELAALRVELDSIRAWGDSLEEDPWVIERVARERFSFIRPGETLFRFVGTGEAAQDE